MRTVRSVQKGINQWSFPDDMALSDIFTAVHEFGYEGIEVTLSTSGPLTLTSSDQELTQIRVMADDAGVQINSVATGLYWQFSFTSNRSDIRQRASDLAQRQLEIAQALGADCILVCPGTVGVDFTPDQVVPDAGEIAFFAGSEVIPYEVAYDRSQEHLSQLADTAKSCKVSIGVENIWNKFLLSPLEFKSFIDGIGSPWIGAYVDVGNMLAFGYPEQWIRILAHRIKRIHLKDYRRASGSLDGFVPLLAGDVNWPEVAQALRDVHYTGYVNAEMVPRYAYHQFELIRSTSSAIDAIFSFIQ